MATNQEEHMEAQSNNSNNSLAGNNSNTDFFLGDLGLYNLDNYFSEENDDNDVNEGQKNNHKIAHDIILNMWKSKKKNIIDFSCFYF